MDSQVQTSAAELVISDKCNCNDKEWAGENWINLMYYSLRGYNKHRHRYIFIGRLQTVVAIFEQLETNKPKDGDEIATFLVQNIHFGYRIKFKKQINT